MDSDVAILHMYEGVGARCAEGHRMYKHILITTDGSELADKGLEHGLALAKAVGADVVIVTVTDNQLPSPYEVAFNSRRGKNPLEERRAAEDAAAQATLEAAAKKAAAAGVSAKTVHIAERHPAEGIVEAAREHKADLIVMSSHGRRGVRRLMLGSQTAEVVTSTAIPVLVVR